MKRILNITHKSLFRAAAMSGFISVLTAILLMVLPSFAYARVTGVCSNCHTMHNSQNGSAVAKDYLDADLPPQEQLLTSDCVGCHSSSTGQTIINFSGTSVPIVYNTVPPSQPLAGGNFYWVATQGDEYGHNVYGISGIDSNISETTGAPG